MVLARPNLNFGPCGSLGWEHPESLWIRQCLGMVGGPVRGGLDRFRLGLGLGLGCLCGDPDPKGAGEDNF
jgi:hypothetical protein